MKLFKFPLALILVNLVLVFNIYTVQAQSCSCDLNTLSCQCCVTLDIPDLTQQFCASISFDQCNQTAVLDLDYNGNSIGSYSVDVSQTTLSFGITILVCQGQFEITDIIVTDKYVQFTPAVSICGATFPFPQQTIGDPSVCIGITNCQDCAKQSACGWCNDVGKCMDGDSSGNFCNKCLLCGWNYGQCDTSATCLAKSPACGFCSSDNVCVSGDPLGPNIGSCSLENWDFLTCAQRGEYIPVTKAQSTYAALGTSLFFGGLALGVISVFGGQYYRKKHGGFKCFKGKTTTINTEPGYRRH